MFIYEKLDSKFPPRMMSALVCENLPKHDIILSLAQMKDWNMLPRDWPKLGVNCEVKSTYIEEEYERNPEETIEMHAAHIENRQWDEMSDTEFKQILLDAFPEVFSECLNKDRKIDGDPIKLSYIDNMEEVIKKIRPAATVRAVPLQFEERARRLIQELIDSDVIESANEETEFCSRGMFIPKADGKRLRLVTDYRSVNKLLKRPATYFTPTDDIRKKLNPQSRFFSTIDLSSGYHQVELS